MLRRILTILLLCGLLVVGTGARAPAHGEQVAPQTALVQVVLTTHEDLSHFQRMGMPAYARLHGLEGDYLLVGANARELALLKSAGLTVRVLDGDIQGENYYLSYTMPVQSYLSGAIAAQVLLDDGIQALVRMTPPQARTLRDAGIALSALHLRPRPLAPGFSPGIIGAVAEPDPFVQSLIGQVDSGTVQQYVGDLSGEWPAEIDGEPFTITSRYTYSGMTINKAVHYVGAHLAALGLDVEYHAWGGEGYPNVIGELRGESSPENIYIICAHLDDAPFEGTAPGADDNASGSAAVLIAADILAQYQWDNTLRFILFTGEEQWSMDEYYAHGSYPYVQRARERGENIIGVLNLDMLGYNSEVESEPTVMLEANASPTLSPTLELAQLFDDVVDTYAIALEPKISAHSSGLGDHGSFWDQGYFAIMGIEDPLDFNPFYHTKYDQLKFLDLAYLTEFVKAGVGTFAHMASDTAPVHERHFLYLPLVARSPDSK